jgi:hypothetical protein
MNNATSMHPKPTPAGQRLATGILCVAAVLAAGRLVDAAPCLEKVRQVMEEARALVEPNDAIWPQPPFRWIMPQVSRLTQRH